MKSIKYFCTYCDVNFLARALALYNSLLNFDKEFHFFVLCLDNESYAIIKEKSLVNITAVPLFLLEQAYPELLLVKGGRSKVEYFWTCGPVFILYILTHYNAVDLITYLDADMFFFSNPEVIYQEMGNNSVGIVEHRFSKKFEKRKKFGIYNVGLLIFRRDNEAIKCLSRWKDQCLDWCYDIVEESRYGDQKYLEEWPHMFNKVKLIQHKGVNVGPWNIANYNITKSFNKTYVDDQELICFHFHGLKEIYPWLYDANLGRSGLLLTKLIRVNIFRVYINELIKCKVYQVGNKSLRQVAPHLNPFSRFIRWFGHICCAIISMSYIVVFRKSERLK
jgi:hypothetical protein